MNPKNIQSVTKVKYYIKESYGEKVIRLVQLLGESSALKESDTAVFINQSL